MDGRKPADGKCWQSGGTLYVLKMLEMLRNAGKRSGAGALTVA
jgi:hypothetical protein